MTYSFAIVLTIIWYVLVVIGAWKMFQKAGESGWKAIIPIYNVYVCFKFSWNTTYFWVWLVLTLVSAWTSLYAFDSGYMNIMTYILDLVSMLITVNLAYHLSMSFGHGFWYALGLAFFPFIFTMIIGFGSSKYVGNTSNLLAY